MQEGEQVFRGQTIGYVEYQEYTGNYPEYHSSDDSHLHFEIRYFADANQVYLTYNNGQYASCARGDKAGRGYTPPDIHAYDFPSSEQGYTDPTDFINSHQATPTPTSTPTAIPTLTPLPGGRGFYPNGIMASYYNDQDDGQWYIGGPITWQTFTNFVISRLESFIAFDTGTSSPAPGVNGTFWSARWTGQLAVPQSENYVFYFDDLDDGARLYLDGNLVLESWLVQGAHDYQTGPIFLNAGLHDIVVEYAQGPAVGGSFYLSWSSSFFAKELIGPAGGQPSTPTPTPTLTPTRPRPCALQALQAQEPALKDLSLFYAAREKLVKTPLGGRYETLYYQYSPNLIRLIGQDAEVRKAFREVILLWRPALQAWVDGQEDVQINVQQVDALRRLVELLAKRGDASLRTVVQEEMKRVPWEQLAGLTLREAEAQFLGTASRPEESVMPTGTPQP
ncbi:MAG: PA14 domain-containing protein [Candidatus Methanomethylicaceae archaeon]